MAAVGTAILMSATAAISAGSSASAATAITIPLPFSGTDPWLGEIEATATRVFLAEGPNGDTVLAFDHQGNQVGALTGLPGPMGMAVSDGTLFVSLAQDASIAAYDATDLTFIRRMSVSPFAYPWFLSRVGDRLFFGHDCYANSPQMGSIRLDGTGLTTYPARKGDRTTYPWYCPMFAGNATDPKEFVAADWGLSPALLLKYRIKNSQGAVRLERSGYYLAPEPYNTSMMEDMVTSPDGGSVIAAAGPPWLAVFDLATFGPDRAVPIATYPMEASAIAVDVQLDGTRIAAGADHDPDVAVPPQADVYVFESGNPTPIFTYDLGSADGARLWPRGVAITPDGQHVFAVSGRFESQSLLHVFHLEA
jgi:hypothetical protein